MASLKINPSQTLKTLKSCDTVKLLPLKTSQMKDLINILFIQQKRKFHQLPNSIKNAISLYINENYSEESSFIDSLVKNGYIPLTYVSSNVLYKSYFMLDGHTKNKALWNYITIRGCGYNSKHYNPNDEKFLLQQLGKKYTSCKTVEDAIVLMHKQNLTRDRMSLQELLCLQLYAAKTLHENGLHKVVDVLAVYQKTDSLGMYDGSTVSLGITGENSTILDMIKTLHHEIEHVMQELYIKNAKINADKDIDVFSKDEILKMILGSNYYSRNHHNISFEFDAEFKAYIKTALLLGLDDSLKTEALDKNTILTYALEKLEDTDYFQTYRRDVCHKINFLFETEMNNLKKYDVDLFNQYIREYPIVKYEYIIASNFTRKSVKDLVDNIENTDSKQEMGIYFNLLKSRLDPSKEESLAIIDNCIQLEKLYRSSKYTTLTKKIIRKLIEHHKQYKDTKYQGYYYQENAKKSR